MSVYNRRAERCGGCLLLHGRLVSLLLDARAPSSKETAVLKGESPTTQEVVEGVIRVASLVQPADERIEIGLGLDAVWPHLIVPYRSSTHCR